MAPPLDVRNLIDPQVAERMATFMRGFGAGATGPELLAGLQAMPQYVHEGAPPEGVRRDDVKVAGAPGDPEVLLCVARPAAPTGPVPAFLSIHGGGYVTGTFESDKPRLDQLVATYGCVAASVEYRLAPATPYPGPLHDCFAALSHLVDNADELGIDRARIAIGGVSAGGGLAAALALMAHDRGVAVAHQQLIYPMLDDRQVTASSQWIVPVWSKELNELGWRSYLGELYGSEVLPAYAAPARASDLSGLPPAYIHVGTLDGFLHEDIDYASRLLAAGVPAELHVFPGAPHGFDGLAAGADVADRANAAAEAALARVLTSS